MNLPHNTTQPESAAYIYNLDQPPVFFRNIPASNAVAPMLPAITAAVANNLSQHSGMNSFRMFAFNFYSKASWNNPDFFDLVAFVVGYVEVEFTTGTARDFQTVVNNCVPDAVSLYIVQLIAAFPALRSVVDNQTLNAFNQNAGYFQGKMSMILNFYQRSGINSPLLQQGMRQQPMQQPMMGGYDPYRGTQQMSMMAPTNMDRQFQQGAMGLRTFGAGGGGSGGDLLRQDRVFTDRKYNLPTKVEPVEIKPVEIKPEIQNLEFQEVTSEMWRPSAKQPHKTMCSKAHYLKRYFDEDGTIVEVIEPREENQLDRAKHSIALLGNTYEMDTILRKDTVSQQLDNLKSPALVEKKKLPDGSTSPEVNFATEERKVSCEVFLEEAIFQGRKQQINFLKSGKKCDAFQCYTSIAKPFITRVCYRDILKAMFSNFQFKEVASYLKQVGEGLAKSENATVSFENVDMTDEIEDSKDRQDLIMFLDKINVYLTNYVNNWLHQKLSMTHVAIDSFVDDVADLPAYLLKYGNSYAEAFLTFQMRALEHSFVQISEEGEKEITLRLNDDDSDLNYTFFAEHYSLSYVNLTAKELQIELKDRDCLLIPELDYPLLHSIGLNATTVANNKPFLPHHFLLITQDDMVFELHRSPLGRPAILINRFNV